MTSFIATSSTRKRSNNLPDSIVFASKIQKTKSKEPQNPSINLQGIIYRYLILEEKNEITSANLIVLQNDLRSIRPETLSAEDQGHLMMLRKHLDFEASRTKYGERIRDEKPFGKEYYEAVLKYLCMVDLPIEEVSRIAISQMQYYEHLLDQLAKQINPRKKWRMIYSELKKQHPKLDIDRPEKEYLTQLTKVYSHELDKIREFVKNQDLFDLPVTVPPILCKHLPTHPYFDPDSEPVIAALQTSRILSNKTKKVIGSWGGIVIITPALNQDKENLYKEIQAHCYSAIAPILAHEAIPGHHLQDEAEYLSRKTYSLSKVPEYQRLREKNNFSFSNSEGWARYAENLMFEQGYYKTPEAKLVALKEHYGRAHSLWLGAQFHRNHLSAKDVYALLEKKQMLAPSIARRLGDEIIHNPINATAAYHLGMLQILQLRDEIKKRGEKFDLKKFHECFLQTKLPIPVIAKIYFDIDLAPLRPSLVRQISPKI